MCEYSPSNLNNNHKFNLDCLDAIVELLYLNKNRRKSEHVLQTSQKAFLQEQQRQQHQYPNTIISNKLQSSISSINYCQVGAISESSENNINSNNITFNSLSTENNQEKISPNSTQAIASTKTIKINEMSSSQQPEEVEGDDNLVTCMLITANVGTIFEESSLLELWFHQLKSYLAEIKPQLVAIHCQEVGGKNYETTMKNVTHFTDKILGDETIVGEYSRVRIFLDEDSERLDKFTALGSLYLVHDSVKNVKLYNFKTAHFDKIEGRDILAAAADINELLDQTNTCNQDGQQRNRNVTNNRLSEHVEKVKFPVNLFPECRKSRKGYMRTRWLFNDCQPLDLVNIHLFHDACNLVAMKTTPSPYAQNRQRGLEFVLQKLSQPLMTYKEGNKNINNNNSSNNNKNNSIGQSQNDLTPSVATQSQSQQATSIEYNQVPLFIFGDFNFRLDTNKVIQRITDGVSPVIKRTDDSSEVLEFVYLRKTSSITCPQDGEKSHVDSKVSTSAEGTNEVRDVSDDSGVVVTVGKKLFAFENLDETFRAEQNTEWLLEMDNELESFKKQLYEFKISFSPSFPFKEDETGGHSYMKTRCPAWCDRILFNSAGCRRVYGKSLVTSESDPDLDSEKRIELLQNQGDVIYRLMGSSVPMGDHKPVLLYFQLDTSPNGSEPNRTNAYQTVEATSSTTLSGIDESTNNLVESTAM